MRRSRLLCTTLRQAPADAELASHQLLVRAGFIQPVASGIYALLPLGERVVAKIERILREEMNAVDGQEVSMPVVLPAGIWQRSGRWNEVGEELVRFRDRGDRDMLLAMTHEEVVAELLAKNVRSYRQLPLVVYQIQTKFRDEPRARGGLIRTREFTMKDAYSCHATTDDLDTYYPRMCRAYFNVFGRCGLDVIAVEADTGMMGGSMAHEFMLLSAVGEDQIVVCESCGYRANRQVAQIRKESSRDEEPLPLEEVETPGTETIVSLADFLGIEQSRTAKAAFFMAGDRLVFAVVRGDMEVGETKLANAIGAGELRPASADELLAHGIVAGYASPIGVSGVTVVVDDLVASSPNLVAGANRAGYHFRNTNYERDYQADIVTDIVAADAGQPCIHCGSPVALARGIELGNTFKLGTRYSEALGARYLDETGASHAIVMGSYGIGIQRLMASIAEVHRDHLGLRWPVSVAPFDAYLVGLDLAEPEVRETAETLIEHLEDAGIEVLFDDRDERAGVKFNDADLIGLPLRLTLSKRTVARGTVELVVRRQGASIDVPLEEAAHHLQESLHSWTDQIQGS